MRQHHPILKIWRVLYPILIHFGLLTGISFAATFLFMAMVLANHGDLLNDTIDLTMKYAVEQTTLAAVISIPLLLLFYFRDRKRGEILRPGASEKNGVPVYLLVIIITGTAGIALNNLIALSGIIEYSPAFQMTNEAIIGANIVVKVIGVGILVPIAEELVFRGLCYNRLKGYTSKGLALVLTSLAFGLYHMNIVQGVFAFALSAIFIALYEQTKSFFMPVTGHIVVNSSSVLLDHFNLEDWMYETYFIFFLSTAVLICVSLACYFVLVKIKNRKNTDDMYY